MLRWETSLEECTGRSWRHELSNKENVLKVKPCISHCSSTTLFTLVSSEVCLLLITQRPFEIQQEWKEREGKKEKNTNFSPSKNPTASVFFYTWAIKHFAEKHTKNRQDYFTELLTRIRVSMTSLHICKLVSLVTSRNRSRVVFLICRSIIGKVSNESEHTDSPTATWQYFSRKTELKAFIQFNHKQSTAFLYKSKTVFPLLSWPFNKASSAKGGWCLWNSLLEVYKFTKVKT